MERSIKEIIRGRHSVRTYDGEPIRETDRAALTAYIGQNLNPFGVPVEFRLLEAAEHGLSSPAILGEHTYLAAKVGRAPEFEMAYGYSFEKACLYAESLGLGTVMLAASLNRAAFEKAMEVGDDEVMPVGSPVGYPAAKRSIRESLMRRSIHADERLPFGELFYRENWGTPLTEEEAGAYKDALEMMRLAPSAANKQPWRAILVGDTLHFLEARSIKESPLGDIQKLDVGIGLCHFDLTMQEEGRKGRFEVLSPGLTLPEGVEYMISYVPET